jgi:hypothetical protein
MNSMSFANIYIIGILLCKFIILKYVYAYTNIDINIQTHTSIYTYMYNTSKPIFTNVYICFYDYTYIHLYIIASISMFANPFTDREKSLYFYNNFFPFIFQPFFLEFSFGGIENWTLSLWILGKLSTIELHSQILPFFFFSYCCTGGTFWHLESSYNILLYSLLPLFSLIHPPIHSWNSFSRSHFSFLIHE